MTRALLPLLLAPLCLGACDPGLTAPASPMVQLAGGVYTLGSTAACADDQGLPCAGDRAPHPVQLSPFLLERTEVTRLQYATCVVAGACREAAAPPFAADHKDDPVLVDSPQAAREYCAWRKLSLPTEAQFELAARLGADGQLHAYPWGDEAPSCDALSFLGCGKGAAAPVGHTARDTSAAGVTDLAGGVGEWVEDAYDPHAGCLDRLGWSDVCAPADPGCPGAHCTGASCLRGCLPPSEDTLATMLGAGLTDTPQCPLVPAADTPPVDPVIRTSSSWGVVRGGGAFDRACALAGYTRRHAAPGAYQAGFRCARIVGGYAPQPPTSYRFTLSACPSPDYPVRIAVASDGKPVDFRLDRVPAAADPVSVNSDGGLVRMVPCGDHFVVRPSTPGKITITASDALACGAWSQTVSLTLGGDVPASGADDLPLAGKGAGLCSLPNGTGSCAGVCKVDGCAAGFRDCDGRFADGCEVDVTSDKANCGACGQACADPPRGIIGCLQGRCQVVGCSARFADCDGLLDNGCEADLDTSPASCGACRSACSTNHVALPLCVGGSCESAACSPGWSDCDRDKRANGCEVNVATDPLDCGGCGVACSTNHIDRACSAGTCAGRCQGDYADCNGDKQADGCEVDLGSDARNCGACKNACAQGKACVAGVCA